MTLFYLVILEIGSFFLPRPAWTVIVLFYASHHWNEWHMLLVEMGVSQTFCPIMVLLVSVSQVDRITGMSYWHQLSYFFFRIGSCAYAWGWPGS
jgi:hypothetical protein